MSHPSIVGLQYMDTLVMSALLHLFTMEEGQVLMQVLLKIEQNLNFQLVFFRMDLQCSKSMNAQITHFHISP